MSETLSIEFDDDDVDEELDRLLRQLRRDLSDVDGVEHVSLGGSSGAPDGSKGMGDIISQLAVQFTSVSAGVVLTSVAARFRERKKTCRVMYRSADGAEIEIPNVPLASLVDELPASLRERLA